MKIRNYIKIIVPSRLWDLLKKIRKRSVKRKEVEVFQKHYCAIVQRLRNKRTPYNVLFLAIDASVWKYDSVYTLMRKDPLFNPQILVCPQVDKGYEFMVQKLKQCAEFFLQKGYEYILSYDILSDDYLDANTLNPDIIFYSNPYRGLIDDRYYIDRFHKSLICYVNYGYINVYFEWAVNLPFHRQVWRYFVECEENKRLIKLYSPIRGKNCKVTGYPMYDAFVQGSSIGYNWKVQNKNLKRIIWSPHHSISSESQMIKLSTFELYYAAMLEMAQKYKGQIQFVFKPHPLLKEALYRLESWGKDRTDSYYSQWEKGENTAIAEGEYVDLFNSSDAMINDSASFTIEYLYMKKPCLYLSNYDRQKDSNEVALQAFDCWYHATTEQQVEDFIENTILKGIDPLKSKREDFYNNVLLPPNGHFVAENIIEEIKCSLKY